MLTIAADRIVDWQRGATGPIDLILENPSTPVLLLGADANVLDWRAVRPALSRLWPLVSPGIDGHSVDEPHGSSDPRRSLLDIE